MAEIMTAQPATREILIPKLLAWLATQGIEPSEIILRHVLGIAKSLETNARDKR
jgi:hypothetical protein